MSIPIYSNTYVAGTTGNASTDTTISGNINFKEQTYNAAMGHINRIEDCHYIGSMEIFKTRTTMPFNYLLCDGRQISCSTAVVGGPTVSNSQEYKRLIVHLTNNSNATTAYLPDTENGYPLGISSNTNLNDYNLSKGNTHNGDRSTTGNDLTRVKLGSPHMPGHSHNIALDVNTTLKCKIAGGVHGSLCPVGWPIMANSDYYNNNYNPNNVNYNNNNFPWQNEINIYFRSDGNSYPYNKTSGDADSIFAMMAGSYFDGVTNSDIHSISNHRPYGMAVRNGDKGHQVLAGGNTRNFGNPSDLGTSIRKEFASSGMSKSHNHVLDYVKVTKNTTVNVGMNVSGHTGTVNGSGNDEGEVELKSRKIFIGIRYK